MKILIYSLVMITCLLADTQNIPTYNIRPMQINYLEYKTQQSNGIQDNILILEIKRDYWEAIFDFSLANIGKQVNIHFDNIKISPYIGDALFANIQMNMPYGQNLSSTLKKLLRNNHKSEDININEKNIFLQKMLKKYPNNYHIIQQLIHNYHAINTPIASQLAINIYESINDISVNKLLLQNDYRYVFDCFNDLNRTNEALRTLDLAQAFISPSEEYLLIEQKGFLYNDIGQKDKAKLYYEKALKLLEETSFITDMSHLDEKQKEEIKEEIKVIKNNEILRLESILKSFNLVSTQSL